MLWSLQRTPCLRWRDRIELVVHSRTWSSAARRRQQRSASELSMARHSCRTPRAGCAAQACAQDGRSKEQGGEGSIEGGEAHHDAMRSCRRRSSTWKRRSAPGIVLCIFVKYLGGHVIKGYATIRDRGAGCHRCRSARRSRQRGAAVRSKGILIPKLQVQSVTPSIQTTGLMESGVFSLTPFPHRGFARDSPFPSSQKHVRKPL